MFRDLTPGRTVFPTPLGHAALAWTSRGLDRLVVPLEEEARVRAELEAACPDRPETTRLPAPVRTVIARLRRHLGGRPDPLTDVPVDPRALTPFGAKVTAAVRRIPPGETRTYGEVAKRLRRPGAARAVARALAANPVPIVVPCHRVLPAGGGLGGYSAGDGFTTKARLLHAEGYVLDPALEPGYAHLRRVDRALGRVIRAAGPYLPIFGGSENPYEVLCTSLVHQQISMKAAATIAGRVRALTPGPGYPTPAELPSVPDEALRGAGLSRQKVGYLRDLAARVADGRLDLRRLRRLDDAAATAALVQVKGIGVWTAQMELIFHLGRLDVWPVDDLGLQDAVRMHLDLPERPGPKEMAVLGERWAPYRSMAAWYLWRLADGGGI